MYWSQFVLSALAAYAAAKLSSSDQDDETSEPSNSATFLLRELPKYLPSGLKTSIALRPEDIGNPDLEDNIRAAVEGGHELCLSVKIPQNTSRTEVSSFRDTCRRAREALLARFGYRLNHIYNLDKLPVLRSIKQAVDAEALTIFTRSFQANLKRVGDISNQIEQLERNEDGETDDLMIQVSIKARSDLSRLDEMAAHLVNLGYDVHTDRMESQEVRRTADRTELRTSRGRIEPAVIIDGFSRNWDMNQAVLDTNLAGFTVTEDEAKRYSTWFRNLLDEGAFPIFRFPREHDHSLGMKNPAKMLRMVRKTAKKFRKTYRKKIKHVLIPFTAGCSKKFKSVFTKAGFTILDSDLHVTSNTMNLTEGVKGENPVICWQLTEETDISQVNEALELLRQNTRPETGSIAPKRRRGIVPRAESFLQNTSQMSAEMLMALMNAS